MNRLEFVDLVYKNLGLDSAPLKNGEGIGYDTCDVIVMKDKNSWREFAKMDDDFTDWNKLMKIVFYGGDYHARVCVNASGIPMQDMAEFVISAMSRKYPKMRFKQYTMSVIGKNFFMNGFKQGWPEKEHMRAAKS